MHLVETLERKVVCRNIHFGAFKLHEMIFLLLYRVKQDLNHNKRPMVHIAHPRKQFKSINAYLIIIMLIKRRKNIIYFMRIEWFFIWTNWIPIYPRMLSTKFGWNWLIGSRKEDEHVKILWQRRQRRRRTTDKFGSENLTWVFGSGELKMLSRDTP